MRRRSSARFWLSYSPSQSMLIADGQFDLFVHLLDCLFDRAAEVAAADTIFDGNIALVAFAIDFGTSVAFVDLAELGERNSFSGGRKQTNVLRSLPERVAILWQVAQHQVVACLALENLGQRVAADRGLNRILHVGNVDLVTSGGIAIHGDVQVGLAEYAKDSQVLDSLNAAHDTDDLDRLFSSRVFRSSP